MRFLPRREDRAERKAKAFKATENSTGKHKSAMEAIGKAVSATGNTDSLMDGILGEHERAGARANQKRRTRKSFAGEQPSNVELRDHDPKKPIPVGSGWNNTNESFKYSSMDDIRNKN